MKLRGFEIHVERRVCWRLPRRRECLNRDHKGWIGRIISFICARLGTIALVLVCVNVVMFVLRAPRVNETASLPLLAQEGSRWRLLLEIFSTEDSY